LPPSGEGVDGGLSVTGGHTMKSIVTKHSIASASIHRTMLQLYGLLSNTMVCLQFTLTDRQTVNATTNAIKTTSNATKILHTNAAKKRPKKLRKNYIVQVLFNITQVTNTGHHENQTTW